MGYPTKKLGKVADFQGGSQPPKSEFIFEKKDGYIRFLQIRDFSSDKNITYIPESHKNRLCNKDDILLGRYGASVGKVLTGKSGAYNVAIMKTFPNYELLDKRYFYFYLNSDIFQIPLLNACSRAAQAGFSKKDIENFIVPLPPLPTQKLIVQKLDSSFEKIDKSIELTKKNLENIEELNKSVLEEVFKENGYKIKNLKDVVVLIMGQSPKSETYNRDGNGLPFYQGKKEFGDINPTPEVYCSSPIKIAEKGDILMSVRAPVGPTNIANETCCIGRGLSAIRPNLKLLELSYLLSYFKKFESEISTLGKGSTFSSITKSTLENLKIPLPPLKKQKEIVLHLDQVFEKNRVLKEKYEKKLKDLEEMKQSLLKEAFEGRLVKE